MAETLRNILWLIPVVPLLGFIILIFGSGKLSKGITTLIGCGTIFISFLISLYALSYTLQGNEALRVSYFDWISAGNLTISFSFLIDPLSAFMITMVTGISFLIHVYSSGYMKEDEGFTRYFSYLNLFVSSMLMLVLGSNYVMMFAGWEGVGLCSYLLIGFWFKKEAYNNAARKAFVMNRIGDLGFLLGLFLIVNTFGSLEYKEVFEQASNYIGNPGFASGVFIAITLLLFVGATGKSAQIPLYTWLPDAMAGPTPVSALIHAATMVTAGIYMVVRSNVLYALAPETLTVIMVIGICTALFAATIGLVQNDIKKVLAYSTVSQLGYMFFALGLGAYSTAIFHVATHAFFKALLFLAAGSVIHAMHHEQDIRKMGGLAKKLPITHITFLIGTLAISGIFPFSGFFSKDAILEHAFHHSPLLWALGVLGALMTTFYMFRLYFLTFHTTFRGTEEQKHHLHESPFSMTIPLIVLAVLATIGGLMGIPELLGGHNWIGEFLNPVLAIQPEEAAHSSTALIIMIVSSLLVIITIGFAAFRYLKQGVLPPNVADENKGVYGILYNKYYVDEFYEAIIGKPAMWIGQMVEQFLEKSGIDSLVNGIGKAGTESGKALRLTQSGLVGMYLMVMVVALAVLIIAYQLILQTSI